MGIHYIWMQWMHALGLRCVLKYQELATVSPLDWLAKVRLVGRQLVDRDGRV